MIVVSPATPGPSTRRGLPAVARGGQQGIEWAEVTPHPHDKQNVGPPARDGWRERLSRSPFSPRRTSFWGGRGAPENGLLKSSLRGCGPGEASLGGCVEH